MNRRTRQPQFMCWNCERLLAVRAMSDEPELCRKCAQRESKTYCQNCDHHYNTNDSIANQGNCPGCS